MTFRRPTLSSLTDPAEAEIRTRLGPCARASQPSMSTDTASIRSTRLSRARPSGVTW